jgi:acetyl esterase/lipase
MSSPKRTFTYKKVDKLEIPLDVYLPEDAKAVPILLWFHGGGLLQGKRTSVAPHMLGAVEKYNLAVVSADYRLAPQVGVKDIYEDVRDCVAFIRDQLPKKVGDGVIDASRLAVSGSSAGGYLAFLAGLYVDPKPKVILPIYPITDPLGSFFTTSQPPAMGGSEPDLEAVKPYTDRSADVVAYNEPDSKRNGMYGYMLKSANLAELLGVKKGDDSWRVARKVYQRGLPPAYIVHGDADTAVGVEQADEVVGVMVGLRTEVTYERLHGVEHLFDKDEKVGMEKMYDWLMKNL